LSAFYFNFFIHIIKIDSVGFHLIMTNTMAQQCIGRISSVKGIRHFHDGKHRFYVEYRCDKVAIPHTELCNRCTDRTNDKLQSSGKFDHGLVTGPIPDYSHMYGGNWYHAACNEWGAPPQETIQEVEAHRLRAREGLIQPMVETTVTAREIPGTIQSVTTESAATAATAATATAQSPPKERKKPGRKPALTIQRTEEPEPKPQPKSRAKPKPVTAAAQPITSVIATHIERDTEEYYMDDYEIEYVKLSPFEHNSTMYFREPRKNKLFQHINGALGDYIGRYDPYTETIRTDIPDSDEE
jgi:hypothetical protein